jgi:hypothetical protein
MNKAAVLFTHFVELIVPFFYFAPKPFRHWAGLLTILFQGTLILSGNLSWLNYVTIVLAIACFDDSILPQFNLKIFSEAAPVFPSYLTYALCAVVAFLSIKPTLNLFSRQQMMNTSFEPLHLVNTYGAFGSITKTRFEVILEGSDSETDGWKEYTFKGKPSEVSRRPPLVSPYHLRLDWQMWFAAMSSYEYHPWILSFVGQLLKGNPDVISLLRDVPFKTPPKYIRASLYEYHYANGSKDWWTRSYKGEYLPPLTLDNPRFKTILTDEFGFSIE